MKTNNLLLIRTVNGVYAITCRLSGQYCIRRTWHKLGKTRVFDRKWVDIKDMPLMEINLPLVFVLSDGTGRYTTSPIMEITNVT